LRDTYTVGICATNDRDTVASLMSVLEGEFRAESSLKEIIAVVSGSTDGTTEEFQRYQDLPLKLIQEPERKGKAEAVNRIMDEMTADHLVLINGDAVPDRGSVVRLIQALESSGAAAVCGYPYLDYVKCDVLALSCDRLLWSVHNKTIECFSEMGLPIHLTDEMIAIHGKFIRHLPEDTINDGAFISVDLTRRGARLAYCKEATVKVSSPATLKDLIEQRKRILLGHMQIASSASHGPFTIEFTMPDSALLALKILFSSLVEEPELAACLPVLLMVEFFSLIGALRLSRKGVSRKIWKRVHHVFRAVEHREV
jgi:cellulose synthase/poly-beta-1,6-N-acetylglucosamine synthase-like glycosyltransferase